MYLESVNGGDNVLSEEGEKLVKSLFSTGGDIQIGQMALVGNPEVNFQQQMAKQKTETAMQMLAITAMSLPAVEVSPAQSPLVVRIKVMLLLLLRAHAIIYMQDPRPRTSVSSHDTCSYHLCTLRRGCLQFVDPHPLCSYLL